MKVPPGVRPCSRCELLTPIDPCQWCRQELAGQRFGIPDSSEWLSALISGLSRVTRTALMSTSEEEVS
ncbi:MAG TPA: hypothetical protein VFD49_09220 [Candidatus Dormibacteraeota bacterium]|nr:hypothetical protein [Candidatus Dormibacteraeota bacterium]